MTNLLQETLRMLRVCDKTPDDVRWVGGEDYYCEWNNFVVIANKTDYYSGFGGQEIPSDIKIVGNDWWLERSEYDGSESWEYKSQPIKPKEHRNITRLTSPSSWSTMKEHEEYNED